MRNKGGGRQNWRGKRDVIDSTGEYFEGTSGWPETRRKPGLKMGGGCNFLIGGEKTVQTEEFHSHKKEKTKKGP